MPKIRRAQFVVYGGDSNHCYLKIRERGGRRKYAWGSYRENAVLFESRKQASGVANAYGGRVTEA